MAFGAYRWAGYRDPSTARPTAWCNGRTTRPSADAAGRAMCLIADGVVEREGVTGLAARIGFSARHLNRLLIAEYVAGLEGYTYLEGEAAR